jgi:hypothetical protein
MIARSASFENSRAQPSLIGMPPTVAFDDALVLQSLTAISFPLNVKNPAQGRVLVLAVGCGI